MPRGILQVGRSTKAKSGKLLHLTCTYALRVGTQRVTALLDSYLPFPPSLVTGAPEHEVIALSNVLNAGAPGHVTINAFLIEGNGRTVLIDTGFGGQPESHKGRLIVELASLGIEAEAITHVLLTHLHADHAGGVVNLAGECAFPNAQFIAHEAERDFWYSGKLDQKNELLMGQYQAAAALLPHLNRFIWAHAGHVLPNIELVHLPGHTPGHSGYRIGTGSGSLLIWGDIVHQPALQTLRPEMGVAFDTDPALAIVTRKKLFSQLAESGERIAGMHLDFPAFGRLISVGGGAYRLVPQPWTPSAEESASQ